MEEYPVEYIEHNRPVILLSGLGTDSDLSSTSRDQSREFLSEGGFRIQSSIPPVTGALADRLAQCFEIFDRSELPWSIQSDARRIGAPIYKIRRVGRVSHFG